MDLIVEPMSFDRIGNLGNSLTMKARLQEEVRFVESLCPQGMGGGTYISLPCVGRSKAATGDAVDEPFRGISAIMMGDLGKLPPSSLEGTRGGDQKQCL